jgi:altronate hydrolase
VPLALKQSGCLAAIATALLLRKTMNDITGRPPFLRLSEHDNVAVAARAIDAGTLLEGVVRTAARIPFGHKVALVPVAPGEAVRKFGQIIGFAKAAIAPGEWVHEHNLAMGDFERDYRFCEDVRPVNVLPPEEQATFQGYRRANGRVGTRNYVGILTSVNCSASVARFIAEAANRSF